jgi:Uma2 family endonuclease
MAEAGLFGVESRYELIDGEIYMMSPIGPSQSAIIRRLTQFFSKRLPENIHCSIQLPFIASDRSEPEPDVALLRYRDDDCRQELPEYWVVDVQRQAIVVHRDPLGDEFQTVDVFKAGQSVAPRAAPMCQPDVSWLFR